MEKCKYNIRNLLYHLKSDYLKNEKPEEYKNAVYDCKDVLYDAVKENVEYFRDVYCNLNNIYYSISKWAIEKHAPIEIYELQDIFNKSATGMYGLTYDNQTNLLISDSYGRTFLMTISNSGKYLEFKFWTSTGHGLIHKFTEPIDAEKFSKENLKSINELASYQNKYNDEIEKNKRRYEEIKQYKDYITVKRVGSGYAHEIKEVTVKKYIPIKLETEEIAKYADNWNYCFGGSIQGIRETEDSTIYRIKIYTD